jgi:putative methionine-R-sulfoxide reductase with GAF domain
VAESERISRQETLDAIRHQLIELLAQSAFEPSAVFNFILAKAKDLIGVKYGELLLVDHKRCQLTICATTPEDEADLHKVLDFDNSFCGVFVVKQGKSHFSGDITQPPYKDVYQALLKDERGRPMVSELAVSVVVDEEIIAVVNVESSEYHAFNKADQQILEELAHATAVSLKQAALARRPTLRSEVDAAVQRIREKSVGGVGDPSQMYGDIRDEMLVLSAAPEGQVLLVGADWLIIRETTGQETTNIARVLIEESFCGVFVVKTGEPHYAPDLTQPRYAKVYQAFLKGDQGRRMASEYAVPVFIGQDMIAILNVESPDQNAFNYEQREKLRLFALEIGDILARAADRELDSQVDELVRSLIETNLPGLELIELVTKRAALLTQCTVAEYYSKEADFLKLEATSSMSISGSFKEIPLKGSVIGDAVQLGEQVYLKDVEDGSGLAQKYHGPRGIRSELALPVLLYGKPIGVLNLESGRKNAFTELDKNVLRRLTRLIAQIYHIKEIEDSQYQLIHNLRGRTALIRSRADMVLELVDGIERTIERVVARANVLPVALLDALGESIDSYPFPSDFEKPPKPSELSPDDAQNIIVSVDWKKLNMVIELVLDNSVYWVEWAADVYGREKKSICLYVDNFRPDDEYIRILVYDNGPGIKHEDQQRILRGFTTKEELKGSGLGLPQCRHEMKKMHGKIYIYDTEVGHHTTMCLEVRRVTGVVVDTSPDSSSTSKVLVFSNSSTFLDLAKHALEVDKIEGELFPSYRLPRELWMHLDEMPHRIVIDLADGPQEGMTLFKALQDHVAEQNTGDHAKTSFHVYHYSQLMKSSRDLSNFLQQTRGQPPDGRLT